MAIINNNVQNVKFLRNSTILETRDAALAKLQQGKELASDGSALLARYYSGGNIVTLVGFVAQTGDTSTSTKHLTVFDVEGSTADVEALRQEINAKLGTGVTSADTATAQLGALSGTSADGSGVTSVWGAKAYANDLIGTLDGGVTAETGYYVKSVVEADGVVSGTTEALPSSADTAVAKKVVIAVSEDKGQIEVTRGEITSSGKTVVLGDGADGGVNFEVNIDGETLIADGETGVISVASAALTQYVGDEDTITISDVDPSTNTKTISSPLTLQKVTTGLTEEVKEEYRLVGANGTTIGEPVKVYKDSHIVSIDYSGTTQKLYYTYIDVSGETRTTEIDMSELVLETEFGSGVTVTDHIAHGVVDQTSENFLTVGAGGFKLSGVQNAIDAAVSGAVETLDADVSGNTNHVTVGVKEEDGIITAVTVAEDNIANADDLAELSGKTVTAITSTNGSITASVDDTVGNKTYNIETDASKIKMSGFTAETSGFTGITTDKSVTEAVKSIETEFIANEQTTAAALNDLDQRLDEIESGYVETVQVNGVALTETANTVNVQVVAATSASTATGTEAIVVNTDPSTGAITLGIAGIDCGTYD